MSATPPAGIFELPVTRALANARNVLVAGAGGGFDVYAGLPLALSLEEAGKKVTLANLSFTYLGGTDAAPLAPGLWLVRPESSGEREYFPEKYLSEWLSQHGYPSDIYCFDKLGVRPLTDAYRKLVKGLEIDAIVLVDGGTDILMRGDEAGLGTPAEDMVSLAAVAALEVPIKIVSCLGFGVDAFHGVCHAHFLENVAALSRDGAYLGTHSLHLSMPAVEKFCAAVEYAHERMSRRQSIVNGSIVSALEGRFGDFHRSLRTRSSELFINPLMCMYWHFDLRALAARSLYLSTLLETETIFEVQLKIEAFLESVQSRKRRLIPV
jgi:hypothetical protein